MVAATNVKSLPDISKIEPFNGTHFKWWQEKDISSQIHEYHVLIDLKNENITLPEAFVAGALTEKLPDSWKDYKIKLKHKRKQIKLEDVIIHIRIEEKNK